MKLIVSGEIVIEDPDVDASELATIMENSLFDVNGLAEINIHVEEMVGNE